MITTERTTCTPYAHMRDAHRPELRPTTNNEGGQS